MSPISIAQFGVGPIGIESLRYASTVPWIKVVGAIDIDPAKTGRSLKDVVGINSFHDAFVYPSFEELWRLHRPDVVLHTAGSNASTSIAQIEPMVRHGVNVASTCEELLFPALRAPRESREIDALARESGSRIVGTGVNPGFVMDVLPVCLTGVARNVDRITVQRVVNASTRRLPLQKKIGSGMNPDAFRALFSQGKAGHAGFRESAYLIAHCMGWELDDLTETCDPVIAPRDIRTEHFDVPVGMTCGLHQRCAGKIGKAVKVYLDLKMYLDAPDSHDAIQIIGDQPLDMVLRGGVPGDQATVAALVNVVPRLLDATPGMKLMTDLAVPCWVGQRNPVSRSQNAYPLGSNTTTELSHA